MRLWLIDAGYLFNAQRSVGAGFQFDYMRLRRKLEESGALWRAYYLNSTPHPPTDAQDAFHSWLRSGPPRGPQLITKLYELKQVRADRAYCEQCQTKVTLTCPHGLEHHIANQQQKGVDVGVATLALTHRDRYETLLLSSGDGDLLDAVEFLSEHGKRIELAVFLEGVSTDLQARADKIYWINEFADEVRREH
ncbi:MAG TPA: NYN domain-containing protein [Thermoanaerobaculia bacterium]|nr:NYN domain-containing protein [Thermoanaerobaculia bacterium]